MRSATWTHRLARVLTIAALALVPAACSKSSKQKETNSSQTSLNGTKSHQNGPVTNPDTKAAKAPGPQTNDKPAGAGEKVLADKPEYTLRLLYPPNLASGASGVARVVLTTKTGWKLNDEYPLKLQISPPTGTKVSKNTQSRTDATKWTKHAAEWQVQITASDAGAKPFSGKFKFAVCTDTTCDPKKELLAWVVNVK